MDLSTALAAARSTAGAVLGQTAGLFAGGGTVYHASLTVDADTQLPGQVQLFKDQRTRRLLIRPGVANSVHAVCLKFQNAYGLGRDQDFLLASSGDGAPLHHATLPASATAPTLYSSLWLYLVGFTPMLFGLRTDGSAVGNGSVAEFCVGAPIGKFRRIGTVTVEGPADDGADLAFAGRHSGGNIRPLPPVYFY